jgi:hypothetical protein
VMVHVPQMPVRVFDCIWRGCEVWTAGLRMLVAKAQPYRAFANGEGELWLCMMRTCKLETNDAWYEF